MKSIINMNEKELREEKSFKPKSLFKLVIYIYKLIRRRHDYGTAVYAMSMSAVATFEYVAHKLGVTGFQVSCADMDIIRRTRQYELGFMILDYSKLLYPQYCNDDDFPGWRNHLIQNKKILKEKANELLDKAYKNPVHKDVYHHWLMIAGIPE